MAFKNYGSKRTSDINCKVIEKYGKLSNNEGKMNKELGTTGSLNMTSDLGRRTKTEQKDAEKELLLRQRSWRHSLIF